MGREHLGQSCQNRDYGSDRKVLGGIESSNRVVESKILTDSTNTRFVDISDNLRTSNNVYFLRELTKNNTA